MDLALTGGWVVDGTGAPPYRADVAVRAGRVEAVGRLPGIVAARQVDCSGKYILPGFVDAHVHGDAAVFDPEVQLAALAQGVTTFIVGQDGLSFSPAGPQTAAYVARYFGAVNGELGDPGRRCSIDSLMRGYDRATPLNVGYLVPRGNLRLEAMGTVDRQPTAEELQHMLRLLAQGMDEGSLGVSTGLDYVPDRYADTPELAAAAAEAARFGGVYVTHMRGYESDAHRGIAEAEQIARSADVPVHVSHYHGPANMLVELVDGARGRGVDLTYDSYPYTRGCSIVAMVALPTWVQAGSTDDTLARLRDADVRDRLRDDWFAAQPDLFERITFASIASPDFAWCEGLALPAAAERAGRPSEDLLCDLLVASELMVSCVFRQPPTNTNLDVRALMRHPAHMASSDAVFQGRFPHPRGWGAFARFLGRHTRELHDYTWGEASLHLAGHAARRFGLAGRGTIHRGTAADLVVLDPGTVEDVATYEDPRRPARGVDRVLVNGIEVFADGRLTGTTPGRALRRGETS